MTIPVYYIDTFTTIPFKGSPTAVGVLEKHLSAGQLQAIATELNLPVTAFVYPAENGSYAIRYFTVNCEIPACGHATLAAARVTGSLHPTQEVIFKTIESIVIHTVFTEDLIYLTYPVYSSVDYDVPSAMLQSIGLSTYKTASFCRELETVFIELHDAALLRSVKPDYALLLESSDSVKEVVITAASDEPSYDFLLRSFCPWIGINEDPVTGSVHSVLAHYWKHRTGKSCLKAWQASVRGGEVYIQANNGNVLLGGKTVNILEGKLFI